MPLYLRESETCSQLAGVHSVLIVPCRFCPAASFSIRQGRPYIELFRKLLRTEAYESYIEELRRRLAEIGIASAVFDSKMLHQFVACMWTAGHRRYLADRAAHFDAALVLGCDATGELVREALKGTGCRVIDGMMVEGVMNVVPEFGFPANISLKLRSVGALAPAGIELR